MSSKAALVCGSAALLFGLAGAAMAQSTDAPVVQTEGGKVKGAVAGPVESFKGIPFAAPPVGNLRWKAPQPAARWPGVRDATAYGHDCMQKPFPSDAAPLGTAPAEDCLVLNVWRPAGAKPGAALPVVVWIYGGGLVNGGSSPAVYDGSAFARQGVVFVSFNYRLGRFGFFAHPALSAAAEGPVANWGFLDQHAAMNWVQRNVARFGGDPARVTVMGESSGAISVMNMIGAPAIRKTFSRAIVMSGAGRIAPDRQIARDLPGLPSAESVGVAFAHSAGIDGSGPAALAALRALPADRIVGDLNLKSIFAGDATTYSGQYDDGITVTGTNQAVFARRGQAPVPILIGTTGVDVGQTRATSKEAAFAAYGADAAAARTAYDPDGTAELNTVVAHMGSDRFMGEPARYIATQMGKTGQPAFLYRFSYVAESMRDQWKNGAPHATDIPYFFDTVQTKYAAALTPRDAAIAKAMNAYVLTFVKAPSLSAGSLAPSNAPSWSAFGHTAGLMDFSAGGTPVFGPDAWQSRLDLAEALATKTSGQ